MAEKPKIQFSVDNCVAQHQGDTTLLVAEGTRAGQPSKRFTLNGTSFKIESVKIVHTRKNKVFEHGVKRINYLPKVGQTRIHTDSLLYPGQYKIEFQFAGNVKDVLDKTERLFL